MRAWAHSLTLGARAGSDSAVVVLWLLTNGDNSWLGWVVGDGALLWAVLDGNPLLLGGSVGLGTLGEGGWLRALEYCQ